MQAVENSEIKQRIEREIENTTATVEGDGYKYQATIISPAFEGKNTVQRHKIVYAALNDLITGGSLHALTLKTLTPEEHESNAS